MSKSGVPVFVDRDDCEGDPPGPGMGVVKRVITRREGSTVLLGLYLLEPGEGAGFDLPNVKEMTEEVYYVVRGRLKVSWDGGEEVAGPGRAIFFPDDGHYEVEAIGQEPVEIVWTGYPAPTPPAG